MKREYGFSGAVRGQFYREDVTIQTPIYLDPHVRERLAKRAQDRGVEIGVLVNEMLESDLADGPAAK
jgi:hypothetical protein